ncbi:MAG TPA: InlB B-repeat-containing protein [Clostridiales bacterium]|nr:InlB B-repeat-containing protein [Clostridiales bacterium]
MKHKKIACRGLLTTLMTMVFLLVLTTFGISAAAIPTSITGSGSITEYSNFSEITDSSHLVTGDTYYFSQDPLSAGAVLTSIPDGCAVLRITTTANSSYGLAQDDGYTIQKFVDVIAKGDGFDDCINGGILSGTVNTFSGIDGTPGDGWYYWCDGGGVHGAGPYHCYGCDIKTLTATDAIVTMNSNFKENTTTIDSSMFSVAFDGSVVTGYSLTDTAVNLGTGDYTFTFTYRGITFDVTIETYTVTYNIGSGGSALVPPATPVTTWAGYDVALPDVTTSHTFKGWYNAAANGAKVGNAGDAYTPANDVALYAYYTDYYTAYFMDQDGKLYGMTGGESGDSIPYPAFVSPIKTGYDFTAFYTLPVGGTAYAPTDTFSANVVYYAQWSPQTYYYALTGSGDSAVYEISSTPGGTATAFGATVQLEPASKGGYDFIGWIDSATGAVYGASGATVPYTVNGATTLTPKFVKDPSAYHQVRFIDAKTGAVYANYYRHMDDTITAPAAPTKEGYTADKWINTADSGDILTAGSSTVSFTTDKDYKVDWVPLEYSVTADEYTYTIAEGNGGWDYDEEIDLEIPAKSGYLFVGWKDNSTGITYGNLGDTTPIPYTIKGETTLSAIFVKDNDAYRIIKFINKESGLVYDFVYQNYGDDNTVTAAAAPNLDGYTFDQWVNLADDSDTVAAGGDIAISSATPAVVTYYAKWTEKEYYYWLTGTGSDAAYHISLTDNSGGGDTPSGHLGDKIQLTIPTKAGYTFVGWVDDNDSITYSYLSGVTVPYTINGETTLTAKFVKDVDAYKLVRFLDEDTREVYGYYYRHFDDDSIVAPAAPSKDGYTFVQWVNAENSNDSLNPNDPVSFGSIDSGEKDYYAQWLGDEQVLTYDGNFDASTHVDGAFTSYSPVRQYFRTDDVVTFDCTGSATPSANDNVIPQDGYRIVSLHVNYTDATGPHSVTLTPDANGICTFTMPITSDHNITYFATAVQTVFRISDQTGANLTATAFPEGSSTAVTTAEAGDTVNVLFTADSGYVVNDGTIRILNTANSQELTYTKVTDGSATYYQFTMPAGDVEIHADAKYDAYHVSLATTNVTVNSLTDVTKDAPIDVGTTPVPAGNTVSFTATADAGYTITSVTVFDTVTKQLIPVTYDANNGGVYSFTMPSADVKITLTAEKNKASLVILDHDNTLLGIEVVSEGSSVTVSGNAISVGGNTYTAADVPGYNFHEWQRTADAAQFNSHTAITGYFIVKPVYNANGYNLKLANDSSDVAKAEVTYPNHTGVTLTTGGTTVMTGDNVEIIADPDPNYQITGVAVRCSDPQSTAVVETRLVSKDPSTGAWTYNFIMPAYDVEVAVYTEAIPYRVSVYEFGFPEGGTYDINGVTTTNADIKQGSTVSIPVVPAAGYYISNIDIYYDIDGLSNITYVRDADNPSIVYNGYHANTENPYGITFTMPQADVNVEITYAKVDYNLTTTCVESTWGSFVGIPATANVGDVIDFTVVANYGYNLKTLTLKYGSQFITPIVTGTPTVDGDGKTTYYYQFTMPASNVALTATFVKNQYTVTFVDYDGKTLETQWLNYLDKPSVPNIIPTRTGYHFTGWTKDTTLENPGYGNPFVSDVFNTTQATVIYATYEINNYDIDYIFDSARGTVTGPANADYNATVTATVTPLTGYKIDTVTATYLDANNVKQNIVFTSVPSDMETGGDYVFTMPAVKAGTKVTFTATFTEITRTVYLANVGNAVVTINGYDAEAYHIDANYDSTVTIKVTPDAGYKLTGLTVTRRSNGNLVKDFAGNIDAAGGKYNFRMPAYNVDVNVTIVPIEYNVTWNNDAHSTISSNIPGGYDYKEAVNFSVTPEAGYQIKSVKASYLDDNGLKQYITFSSDEPTDLTATCDYSFTMPMNNVAIVVVTEPIIYKVSVNVVGSGAYRLNSNDTDVKWTTAAYKSTVKITPEPALGWELSTITASNSNAITANGDGTYTLSMDNHEDVTVTITYIETTYNISYNDPANGAISLNDLTKEYQHDANFTVTPDDGYQIKSVVGTYTDENGKKQTITFKATPSDIVAGGIYTFTMPAANVSIVVEFEEITYKVVTGSVTGQGEVRLNSTDTANITAKYGETVKVTATPKDGWYLKALTVTNDTTAAEVPYTPALAAAGGDYTFTMPSSDVTVSAEFAKITYNISTDITYAGYGTITVVPTASENDKVDFTVTPNYGYKITKVFVKDQDGKVVSNTAGAYTFTMPAKDVTVYAIFEKIDYTVVFKDYDGKVLKSEEVPYLDGATAPTAPAEAGHREGYTFTGWDKDFSSVTQAMTVTAQYKVNTPTVTVAATANGATSVDNTTPAYGDTVIVTADPADGYRFKSISVIRADGKPVAYTFVKEDKDYVTTYKFTMPDDHVTVTVEYTEEASSDYTDVRTDDWFYDAVKFVSDRGYFQGVYRDATNNLFAPRQNMTRAMFVTVLGRLYGVDTSLYTDSAFEDVSVSTWYGPYVAWAAENNIVNGYGDANGNGTPEFGPTDDVTREQMAAIMYRYAQFGSYDLSGKNEEWMNKYSDSEFASTYAYDAIAWCVGNGIIHGYSVTETEWKINPQGLATRAEVAQVIKNFVDKVIYR